MLRRSCKLEVKSPDLIGKLLLILQGLSAEEADGISGVAVKCVDIRKNTSGEGGPLVCH